MNKFTGETLTVSFALALLMALILLCIFRAPLDHDEIEHAHCAWQVSDGATPYQDFFQIHMPAVWYAASPVFRIMPPTVNALIICRMACMAACALAFFLGVFIGREVSGRINMRDVAIQLLLVSVLALMTQVFQFRPDPFMMLFATAGVLFAVRMHAKPCCYAFLTGVSLGLAIFFSPKMIPLLLLVPLVCLGETFRTRSIASWRVMILYLVGLAAGMVPLAVLFLGTGIMERGFHSVFGTYMDWAAEGAEKSRPAFKGIALPATEAMALAVAVVVTIVERRRITGGKGMFAPVNVLLVSAGLSLSMIFLTYHYSMYNLQTSIVLFAVLSSIIVNRLFPDKHSLKARLALVVIATCSVVAGVHETISLHSNPQRISRHGLQTLISLVHDNALSTQLCMPFHPVFYRNISPLYSDGLDVPGNAAHVPVAVDAVMRLRPHLVSPRDQWVLFRDRGYLDDIRLAQLFDLFNGEYVEKRIDTWKFLARKDVSDLVR